MTSQRRHSKRIALGFVGTVSLGLLLSTFLFWFAQDRRSGELQIVDKETALPPSSINDQRRLPKRSHFKNQAEKTLNPSISGQSADIPTEEPVEIERTLCVALRNPPKGFSQKVRAKLVDVHNIVILNYPFSWDPSILTLGPNYSAIMKMGNGIDRKKLEQPLFFHAYTDTHALIGKLYFQVSGSPSVSFDWNKRKPALAWKIEVARPGQGQVGGGRITGVILGDRDPQDLIGKFEPPYIDVLVSKSGIARLSDVPPQSLLALRYHANPTTLQVESDWKSAKEAPILLRAPNRGAKTQESVVFPK